MGDSLRLTSGQLPVGKPAVGLGLDLFGGWVLNALSYCVGLSETDPPPRGAVR